MAKLIKLSELGNDPEARLRRNLTSILKDVRKAAERSDRDPEAVRLVAVTKYVDVDVVRLLHRLGATEIGESRVQEGARKADSLVDLAGLRIHLIGHLQRNKARRALEMFHAIHSLDSIRLVDELARRLDERTCTVHHVFVEINISGETQKSGLAPGEAPEVLRALASNKLLAARLEGLMGMAAYHRDPEASRPAFRSLRLLRDRFCEQGLLPEGAGLSMGMSSDFAVAVEEGATAIRVGSRIFEEEGS